MAASVSLSYGKSSSGYNPSSLFSLKPYVRRMITSLYENQNVIPVNIKFTGLVAAESYVFDIKFIDGYSAAGQPTSYSSTIFDMKSIKAVGSSTITEGIATNKQSFYRQMATDSSGSMTITLEIEAKDTATFRYTVTSGYIYVTWYRSILGSSNSLHKDIELPLILPINYTSTKTAASSNNYSEINNYYDGTSSINDGPYKDTISGTTYGVEYEDYSEKYKFTSKNSDGIRKIYMTHFDPTYIQSQISSNLAYVYTNGSTLMAFTPSSFLSTSNNGHLLHYKIAATSALSGDLYAYFRKGTITNSNNFFTKSIENPNIPLFKVTYSKNSNSGVYSLTITNYMGVPLFYTVRTGFTSRPTTLSNSIIGNTGSKKMPISAFSSYVTQLGTGLSGTYAVVMGYTRPDGSDYPSIWRIYLS